jgi:undecaprenyl-diphosphatase
MLPGRHIGVIHWTQGTMVARRRPATAGRKPLVHHMLRWDEAILVWVTGRPRARPTTVMRGLTRMGDASTWFVVSLFLVAAGSWSLGIRLAMAAMLGSGVAGVVKRLARRRRPNEAIEGFQALAMNPDQFSFPSGHTATAVAIAVAMAHQGAFLGTAAGVLAGGIAVSRVYLGAHYPLDVAVGALIGVATGLLTRVLVAGG